MIPQEPPQEEARLRRDARTILAAALDAVEPEGLVREVLQGVAFRSERSPSIMGSDTGRPGPTGAASPAPRLLAVGKAGIPMVRGACGALDERSIDPALVLVPEGAGEPDALPPGVRCLYGGHPLPTSQGSRSAGAVLDFLRNSGPNQPLIVLLSGGASALLALPEPGLRLSDLRAATDLLLRAGASIQELNTVRKHLERTKGGRLAEVAVPAPVRGLVISDVVGDDLTVIGSGPFSPDPSTFEDALRVVRERGLEASFPPPLLRHLIRGARGRWRETPKPGDPCFDHVELRIIASVATAAQAAREAAERLGYRTHVNSLELVGEARMVGRRLGVEAVSTAGGRSEDSRPICLLTGGETTVTVTGGGRGGRNQELTLAAALEIAGCENVLVASLATDGSDGPTDAAGAIATGTTLSRAGAAGLDPERTLRENDSYPFFRDLDDLLVTGPTGTNVMDLQMILVR